MSSTYSDDFNAVKALGRGTGSTRTDRPDGTRAVLGGQCHRPLEPGRQPDRARQSLVDVAEQPASRAAEHCDGRHGDHDLERQAVLRREFRARSPGGPQPRFRWQTSMATRTRCRIQPGSRSSTRRAIRNILPGIPASTGRPQRFCSATSRTDQKFTLTTPGQPSRTYTSIAQARSDGNNARVWGGMHYPSTVEISDALGESIADYVNRHSMQRRRGGR